MTPDELRWMTQNYWLDAERLEYPDAVRQYVQDLLPHELAYARGRDAIPSRPQPCDCLALLVGYSWEPLLQAVCVYRPRHILLVLNEHYGDTSGVALGRELADVIHALPQQLFPAASEVQIHPDPLEPAGERPAQIFRFLRDRFLPRLREAERPPIVLDITGAKKSMVAGAYLFGAHAYVDVSYVDFDEYDPRRSRPYGYSCRIGLLANPYEAFRLHDWQRVGQLYDQYAFGAARALLGDILASAGQQVESGSDDPLYTPEEQRVIDELTGRRFLYRRVGHDERPLRLERGAKVGEGAAECERRWDVNIHDGRTILTLSRLDRPTCHLQRNGDGSWHGQWLEHERMPIEFIPLEK